MVLKILQWNLNGYLNNYTELKLFKHENKPHIIALQETHLKTNPSKSCIPKNFSFYGKNCTSNFAKNGVAFLVTNSIPHKIHNLNTELDAIAIEIQANTTFIILNIYLPPSKSFSPSDLTHLISNFNKPVLIIGDFNARSPQWGSSSFNKRGRLVSKFISDNDLLLLNNSEPTHFSTHNSFSNIDLSLCSSSLYTLSSWSISKNLHGSDHFPITITLFHTSNFNFKKRTVFKTDTADWKKFQSLGSKYVNFDANDNNINYIAARFHRGIIRCANESMTKSTSSYKRKPICWWNDQVSQLRDKKREKWKEFKRTKCIDILIEYKRAKALFKRESKIAKRTSFVEYTKDINPETSSKILWDKVKALNCVSEPNTIKYLLTPNGEVIDQPKDIANTLGKTWSNYSLNSNFSDEFNTCKQEIQNSTLVTYRLPVRTKLIEKEITLLELQSCLNTLKGKTPGFDQINYPMIKNLALPEKEKLCILYNKIFDSGVIPNQWKKATVIPIRKPNKPLNDVSGYRPISLLSCISKTLEKIVSRRLVWLLTQDNRLSINQTAYKAHSGTLDALLALDDYISNSLSSKNHTSIISIDAEKAFDRVGIHSVIHQLQEWKIGPKMLNYVKSFLSNRRFCVRLCNHYSDTFKLENGIPQGSPLSVILFLVAFNKLSVIINDHKYFKHIIYADDLYIYRTMNNQNIFNAKLSELFELLSTWCKYSGVKISNQKCKHLHICKKISCTNIVININLSRLENVSDLRILGITFDKKYLWTPHVKNLCKSLQNRLNVITCLSNLNLEPNTKSLIDITKATIMSKIDYGLTIYGYTSKRNLSQIKTIYHAAIRRSLGAFRTSPIKNMLAECGLLSIEDRRTLLTGLIINKFTNPNKSIISDLSKKRTKRKRVPKKPSALLRAINFAKTNFMLIENPSTPKQKQPPWQFREQALILKLTTRKKETTSSEVFMAEYPNIIDKYKNSTLIFTDGSKSESGTGFSFVVKENNNTIATTSSLLPHYASVFMAEAEAILAACLHATLIRKNTLICTDSLSSLSAIQNVNCNINTICSIRDIITFNKDINILWIPSHIGIPGNEEADQAAKKAACHPLIVKPFFNKKDNKKYVKNIINGKNLEDWSNYSHVYKLINPLKTRASYPTIISRREAVVYTRFRIGHTRLTHKYLFDSSAPTDCIFCLNDGLSVRHILFDCPQFYQICQNHNINNIADLLTNINVNNIQKFSKLLKTLKIFFEI